MMIISINKHNNNPEPARRAAGRRGGGDNIIIIVFISLCALSWAWALVGTATAQEHGAQGAYLVFSMPYMMYGI